jgi:putative transposase
MRGYPQRCSHFDEVFVKLNCKIRYLWHVVDHEGEVSEAVVPAKRDKATVPKRFKRLMKRYGAPRSVITHELRAYSVAMNEIGAANWHEVGCGLNNQAENSHQPFRRRERAMQRFRTVKTLQKFSHLVTRQVYKQRGSPAAAECRALVAYFSLCERASRDLERSFPT